MASRRSLISRQNRDSGSPAVQRARGNGVSGPVQTPKTRQPAALPPYEPPSCPLDENAKRSLANITSNLDLRNYEKHLNAAVKNLTEFAGESNDHLHASQERARRLAQRREATQDDSEKTEAEEEAEQRAREMEKKVEKLTAKSDKALRDLIDYKQELAQQGEMLQAVSDEAAATSAAAATAAAAVAGGRRATRRERRADQSSDDEDSAFEPSVEGEGTEMGGAESQAAILSPTELLKKAREEYQMMYTSKTLRARYASNNDYVGFKRIVHDAQHPGDNAPPVPPASSWFQDEGGAITNPSAARRRRIASQTDNTENGDDGDEDDIQMTAVVSSLKCPLTLQTFKEPYSNHICKHTFEKSAILQFHRENAVAFADPSQGGRRGRGVPAGPKQLKCPERGCDAMLELKDFYLDNLILRQVRRHEAQAAADMDDDSEEGDDIVIPGTQLSKPQDIKSGTAGRHSMKMERMSSGPSQARAAGTPVSEEDDDPEPIDMDD